jgi:tetratricopeptide (TPR) repeat protein
MAMVSTPAAPASPPFLRWLPWLLLAIVWVLVATFGLLRAPVATPPVANPRGALPQMPPAAVDQRLSPETALAWLAARRQTTPEVPAAETAPASTVPQPLPETSPVGTTGAAVPTSPATAAPSARTTPAGGHNSVSPIAAPTVGTPSISAPTPAPTPTPAPAPAADATPDPTSVPAAAPTAPRDAGQALAAATAHLNAGRWAEADTAFSEVLALPGARTAAAWFGRARARDGLGRTDEALADLEAALTVDARHPYALLLAGDIHKRRGDATGAASWYRRYLEAWPQGRRAAELQAWLKRH